MNDHLKPAFDILVELENAGLPYSVYGGVAIAGFVGNFFRRNRDIDVFITNDYFEKAEQVLKGSCIEKQFRLEVNKEGIKPKINYFVNEKERLSVIAVIEAGNSIVFKYEEKWGGDETYHRQILERVERRVGKYRFFTPPDLYIKEIFKNHMKGRREKKSRREYVADAGHILGPEDFVELNWKI
jgi:hypothetical protein